MRSRSRVEVRGQDGRRPPWCPSSAELMPSSRSARCRANTRCGPANRRLRSCQRSRSSASASRPSAHWGRGSSPDGWTPGRSSLPPISAAPPALHAGSASGQLGAGRSAAHHRCAQAGDAGPDRDRLAPGAEMDRAHPRHHQARPSGREQWRAGHHPDRGRSRRDRAGRFPDPGAGGRIPRPSRCADRSLIRARLSGFGASDLVGRWRPRPPSGRPEHGRRQQPEPWRRLPVTSAGRTIEGAP